MKAYHLNEFGSADGIVLRDDPVPQPGPREALVRVHARSLNYRDLLILSRQYPLPATQGVVPISDGAGVVVAVGEGVTRLAPGDRVAATYFPRWRDGRIEPDLGMEQFDEHNRSRNTEGARGTEGAEHVSRPSGRDILRNHADTDSGGPRDR